MKRAHLASNGDVSLFEFAINPDSFGQTVENLFYISFLIREGSLAVAKDDDGLPTLSRLFPLLKFRSFLKHANSFSEPSQSRSLSEQREQNVSKHQAVFSLDWATWQGLVEAFQIEDPLIPHRDDEHEAVTARGWYG